MCEAINREAGVMKTAGVLILSALGIATTLFLSSCGPPASKSRIVEISSGHNIELLNYGNFEVSESDADSKIAVYLAGPAFLLPASDDDDQAMYLYMPEDGNRVDLRVDGDLLHVNGIVRGIYGDTDKPRNFAAWFATADETALKSLRIIGFEGKNEDAFENEFKAIQAVNPRVFILIDPERGEPAGEEAPSKVKPLFFMVDSPSTNHSAYLAMLDRMDLSETRVLMVADINAATLDVLTRKDIPNLYRLILLSDTGANRLLNAFPHVKAVTLGEGDESPDLGKLGSLEELHVIHDTGKLVMDFGQLPNPEALRALTINGITNATGLERLTKLEYLNPGIGEMSDEKLGSLLANYPNLIFLDLVHATLGSLEGLRSAPHLEAISLGKLAEGSDPDLTPLADLKHLRYIGLSNGWAEPEMGAAIHEVCPQVVVYQHDKFCLGSGWLVAFLPALLILLLLKRFQVKNRNGVS